MFEVNYSNHAVKFLKNCDKNLAERILEKIEELRKEPFPQGCKMVEGRKEKTFRVRVGKARILYCVFQELNKIFISDIDKRPHVYD